jgi:hypothetical protein
MQQLNRKQDTSEKQYIDILYAAGIWMGGGPNREAMHPQNLHTQNNRN